MNLDERINKNNRKQEERKKLPIPEDEEEYYMYDVRKAAPYINESKNGVFDVKNQSGINTAKSVFDKSIFHTQ